ncbi:TetR/AcrR family transcriptional regulator [Burkholderia sp. F1]|uniref:TetR/AcrR family transcriptional regulator n=1 Tax=Burkholderia sp. F1 TaxID=3366817 RepID=UPI003D72F2BF
MKVSKEQMAENRERILDAAAQLFRERGFAGIGVADLMKAVGLTHGGFYGHFDSKEELMAEASARALEQSHEQWTKWAARAPEQPLEAIASRYLSARHRDQPGEGCALAALSADAARQGSDVRDAMEHGLRALADVLARHVPGRTAAVRRERALAVCAGMIGALTLSRVVNDREFSEEILAATLASFTRWMPAPSTGQEG